MERRADRQQHGAPRARCFGQVHRPSDRARMSRDHDLFRRVQIRRTDNLALSGLGQDKVQLALRQFQQRRHRANARRHGFLHVLPPLPNEANRVGESQTAGRDERGVFPQTVTRDVIGRVPALLRTAQAATDTVSSAGWVFSVSFS